MTKKKKTVIPFELKYFKGGGYHLFIKMKVDNHVVRFLIDTGASKTVLDKSFVKENLPHIIRSNNASSTGLGSRAIKSEAIVAQNILIGERMIKNLLCAVVDLRHVNAAYETINAKPIHGVLGSDVLKKYSAVLDYGTKRLTLF